MEAWSLQSNMRTDFLLLLFKRWKNKDIKFTPFFFLSFWSMLQKRMEVHSENLHPYVSWQNTKQSFPQNLPNKGSRWCVEDATGKLVLLQKHVITPNRCSYSTDLGEGHDTFAKFITLGHISGTFSSSYQVTRASWLFRVTYHLESKSRLPGSTNHFVYLLCFKWLLAIPRSPVHPKAVVLNLPSAIPLNSVHVAVNSNSKLFLLLLN